MLPMIGAPRFDLYWFGIIIVLILAVVILMIFPQIATFLPSIATY